MKAHGHYFSSEIPWDSSARSHGHNTTVLILNFNEKHKCSLWVWLAGAADTNKWSFPLWVRNNGGNYQDKETIILHQLSSVLCLSVVLPCLSLCLSSTHNMSSTMGEFQHSSLTPCVFLQSMIKYRITGFYANFGEFNSVAPCPT